ncbi:exodeoxyribonuclease III [Ohtaekwangia koreensis]|jgi:exodeoxyribonuclease-3|uniref:Exodeoxyribonuclease-3 n=1 Tax=Ohtaekwangia koreensis TaxID=688867 RepID=A0A1T5JLF6_9BACT|nr:exodeoxyribonuclease III [Ohtaekwangia koreensis]SKC52216.1 exodeoxyribonuclease-3 [Ohtaekwangia koreensis]
MHLVNWNVNGIRSIIKKDFLKDVKEMDPDILCFQETKAAVEEVRSALELLPGYHVYINSSKARKGYSGTAILSKEEPIQVTYDMGQEEHDQEGRVITAEYPTFFLVTVYTPNAGEGLARLDYRERWDKEFREYVNWLTRRKPVITCGDFNVAHQAIDIARPKENYNKSAGYTQREIDGFTRLLESGFIDTFRRFYPEQVKYTYWNYLFNARTKNVGWRIDYFLVSESLIDKVKDAAIYNQYLGSDHCPVALQIEL